MNPHFQQISKFFHHLAEMMHDPNGINLEKIIMLGVIEFKVVVHPTNVEQWLENMKSVSK